MSYKLSDVCQYGNERISTSSLDLNNYVSTENLLPEKGGLSKSAGLPKTTQTVRYDVGDVLVSNIRPYFRKIWYADKVGGCSNDVLVFKANDKYDSKFLYYVLSNNNFFDYSTSTSKGTKMPRGDKFAIMDYLVPELPRNVQIDIALTLSRLDNKIQINNKTNNYLEQMAQAIFKSWFVDFEPFQDCEFEETPLEIIPKGWRYEKIGTLCESVSKKHNFQKERLIFLNTGDIENGQFLHDNYSNVCNMPGQAKKSIKYGDILYSEIRPINNHFAYVNFNADDYVVSTKLMVIRSKQINSRRLYNYLTSKSVIMELQTEAESRSGTFPQIRFENIQNLNMLLADDIFEDKYSKIIESIYDLIDSNIIENQRITSLRDTILPKLISGEIDVSAVQI